MNYNDMEQVRSYNYKIQWLFGVAPDLFENYKQERKDLFAVIRALGANSFDKINLKDSEGRVIGTYKDERFGIDQKKIDNKAVNFLKYQFNKSNNIYYVELIRK